MNIHSSFILIAKNQKQPKCPLTCERNKKLWYIHTVEYYSVTKKKSRLLLQATTCTNARSIIPVKEDKHRRLHADDHIYMKLRNRQNYNGGNKTKDCRELGEGRKTVCKQA